MRTMTLACGVVAAACGAALGQQSCVMPLTGIQIRNATNQTATSAPNTIGPAYRYHYVIDANVRGMGGLLAVFYPNPTPLAQVMETFAPGSSAALVGDADNCLGTHPVATPQVTQSGSTTILGTQVNFSITMQFHISAGGVATFDITNVVLTPATVGYLQCTSGTATISRVNYCSANCDQSTAQPVLNVNDFQCFLNKFASGDTAANCDCSTGAPILNVNDFSCFLNRFAVGCS